MDIVHKGERKWRAREVAKDFALHGSTGQAENMSLKNFREYQHCSLNGRMIFKCFRQPHKTELLSTFVVLSKAKADKPAYKY